MKACLGPQFRPLRHWCHEWILGRRNPVFFLLGVLRNGFTPGLSKTQSINLLKYQNGWTNVLDFMDIQLINVTLSSSLWALTAALCCSMRRTLMSVNSKILRWSFWYFLKCMWAIVEICMGILVMTDNSFLTVPFAPPQSGPKAPFLIILSFSSWLPLFCQCSLCKAGICTAMCDIRG